jgi:hypothetical protein
MENDGVLWVDNVPRTTISCSAVFNVHSFELLRGGTVAVLHRLRLLVGQRDHPRHPCRCSSATKISPVPARVHWLSFPALLKVESLRYFSSSLSTTQIVDLRRN